MTTATVLALGRETFDVPHGQAQVDGALRVLEQLEVSVTGDVRVATDPVGIEARLKRAYRSKTQLIIVLQATFTDATAVISLAETTEIPIVVWSFPESRSGGRLRLNSMCGANLAAYSLRRRDHRCAFVHVDPVHCDAPTKVQGAITAALSGPRRYEAEVLLDGASPRRLGNPAAESLAEQIDDRLRHSRVGILGLPPDGFEPCCSDDRIVTATTGIEISRLPLDDLFCAARGTPACRVEATLSRFDTTLQLTNDVATEDLEPSARLYCGMDELVNDRDFAAIATRCWPECMTDFGGAACTPQAMMTEDGVPSVCEADALGAATALMLHLASGDDPFIADLIDVDENDDTSVVWHCGVASARLAQPDEPLRGTRHPNRDVPLINEFALKPGRVTVARLSQCNSGDASGSGLSLVIAGGQMLDHELPFTGTAGTLRWDLSARDVVKTVFNCGVEHHLGIVYGEHRDVLVELAHRWSIPVIRLGHDALELGTQEGAI